jgi:hypothetical protein
LLSKWPIVHWQKRHLAKSIFGVRHLDAALDSADWMPPRTPKPQTAIGMPHSKNPKQSSGIFANPLGPTPLETQSVI